MSAAPFYSDQVIKKALSYKNWAMIGASLKEERPSNRVFKFLKQHSYHVTPINPAEAGKSLDGVQVLSDLNQVKGVEVVDIFRKSEDVPPIVDEAIKLGAKVVWMQQGVRHDAACKKAESAGLLVIMDRCPKIEITRLSEKSHI